jgi:hypothetical protein
MKIYNRKPTLDDAKILRNLIEEQWEQHWISVKLHDYEDKLGRDIWRYGVSIKVDVIKALQLNLPDVKYPIIYLYAVNKVEEFKQFMSSHRETLKHVYKRNDWIDFSSQAYNNSADDL